MQNRHWGKIGGRRRRESNKRSPPSIYLKSHVSIESFVPQNCDALFDPPSCPILFNSYDRKIVKIHFVIMLVTMLRNCRSHVNLPDVFLILLSTHTCFPGSLTNIDEVAVSAGLLVNNTALFQFWYMIEFGVA